MKVVHLSTTDFWEYGTLAYRIHRSLLEKGIESVMITLLKNSGDSTVGMIMQDPVYEDKIKIKNRISSNANLIFGKIMENWSNFFGFRVMPWQGEIIFSYIDSPIDLYQLPEVMEADVIHLHWTPGIINFEMAPVWFLGKKVIITLYDDFFFTGGCHFSSDCNGFLEGCKNCPKVSEDKRDHIARAYRLKKRFYEFLHPHVVAPSNIMLKRASSSNLFKNIEFIPFGSHFYVYNANRIKARESLGLPLDAKIILGISPSVAAERKRFDMFIKAVNLISEEIKNMYIILIGSDDSFFDQRSKVPLHKISLIPNEEILSWYYISSDIFVSTDISEGVSLYALDAMSTGLPLIGFRNSPVEDLVKHEKNGFLVEEHNIHSLARAIKEALVDGNKTKSMKRAAKIRSQKFFSLNSMVEKYINLYTKKVSYSLNEYIKWGEELFSKGKKDMALMVFERVLSVQPQNPELLNNIGVIYWSNKNYKKALFYLEKAYDMSPHSEEIKNNYLNAKKIIEEELHK